MKAKVAILFLFFFLTVIPTFSQCAMCRVAVENNINNGEKTFGSGLNTGILYLLAVPYLALATVGFFWYKNSKKQYANLLIKRNIIRKVSSL